MNIRNWKYRLNYCFIIWGFLMLSFLFLMQIEFIRGLELKSLDIRHRIRGKRKADSRIVLVCIDDKSVDALGEWPWTRFVISHLIERISSGKPRCIGLNLFFLIPEQNIEIKVAKFLEEEFRRHKLDRWKEKNIAFEKFLSESGSYLWSVERKWKELDLSGFGERSAKFYRTLLSSTHTADSDLRLSASIKRAGNVILPVLFQNPIVLENPPEKIDKTLKSIVTGMPQEIGIVKVSGSFYVGSDKAIVNIPLLSEAAYGLGHEAFILDRDNVLRDEIPALEHRGKFYSSFPLVITRCFLGGENLIRLNIGKSLNIGERIIPLREDGKVLINYCGPKGTFGSVSASDVLYREVSEDTFRDKIVLIGWTASNSKDYVISPFGKEISIVEKNANVIENILNKKFLRRGKEAFWIESGFLFFWGIILTIFVLKNKLLYATYFLVLSIAGYLGFVYSDFVAKGEWFYLVVPLIAMVGSFSSTIGSFLIVEERKKRKLKRIFKDSISPFLFKKINSIKLNGGKKEITIVLSGLKYNAMDEKYLLDLWREYYFLFRDAMWKFGGMVKYFGGNRMMAVFGYPFFDEEHSLQACKASLEFRKNMLNHKLNQKKNATLSIGIDTGEAIIGEDRTENIVVIGDVVNNALRFQEVAESTGIEIILTEETAKRVKNKMLMQEINNREKILGYEILL